jgi:hypothetical protein
MSRPESWCGRWGGIRPQSYVLHGLQTDNGWLLLGKIISPSFGKAVANDQFEHSEATVKA